MHKLENLRVLFSDMDEATQLELIKTCRQERRTPLSLTKPKRAKSTTVRKSKIKPIDNLLDKIANDPKKLKKLLKDLE